MRRSPAEHVIRVFGGVRATARAIGRAHTAVVLWRKPKAEGGTGGKIPNAAITVIADLARRQKLDITADDLIYGRDVDGRKKESK